MEDSKLERSPLSNHTVAVYKTRDQAEGAIRFLGSCGHEVKHVSIVSRNFSTEDRPMSYGDLSSMTSSWEKLCATDRARGLLFGSAMLFVPGLNTIMFGGWLVNLLEGAVAGGDMVALRVALEGIGVPQHSLQKYEQALELGRFLIFAHGTERDVKRAHSALANTPAVSIDSFTALNPQVFRA